MDPSTGIAIYDPRRTNPEVFLNSFVARKELTAAMLAKLAQVPESGMAEHQIFIGQRGLGKTSLLRRLALGIDRDPALEARLLPLTFREEQYNVRSLARLWKNCAEALAEWADAHGQPELAARLDADLTGAHWRDDEKAGEAFLGEMKKLGRRAVLFLDNLDFVLDALKDQHWKLRNILQRADGPVIYGASTRFLSSTGDQKQAFYEFFRPHVLEQLTAQELLDCLRQLATLRGEPGQPVLRILAQDPKRLTTLQQLTGGNPRVLALLYQLLERGESSTVYEDLEGLLDQLTPFYKARIEEYQSEQQRAIIDAVALHWSPITSHRLAEITDVAVTTISSQLTRLKQDGLIEDVATSGARAGYQLCERFFNIWYLMRHGTRRTTQKVKWLTEFLRNFYGTNELRVMRLRAQSGENERAEYFRIALEAALEPSLTATIGEAEGGVKGYDENLNALFYAAADLHDAGELENALRAYNDFITGHIGSAAPAHQELVAGALYNKGIVLGELGLNDEAIAAYEEVDNRFRDSVATAMKLRVAPALINKGLACVRIGRCEEAITIYDQVINRFGSSVVPALQERVARALYVKGGALGQLGRAEEEIVTYDEVIRRFGSVTAPFLQEWVAKAMRSKAFVSTQLGHSEQAVAVFGELVERFGDATTSGLQDLVASALFNKGFLFRDMERNEEAISVFDEVINRFGVATTPELQDRAANAMVNKAVTLEVLGRNAEAIALYDEVVNRFGNAENPDLQREVAHALHHKGLTLKEQGRDDEALAVYDEVVRRYANATSRALLSEASVALCNKGNWHADVASDYDAAKGSYLESIRVDPDSLLAKCNLAWLYLSSGRKESARNTRSELGSLHPAGLMVLDAAFAMVDENFGETTRLLGLAYSDHATAVAESFSDDVWRLLRMIAARGYGEKLIDWFKQSGQADRQAPLYAAFLAFVRGERFLNDFSPEVRAPALPIYRWLTRQKPAPH